MVFSLVISCDTVIKFIRSVPYQFLNILASSAIHATKPSLTKSNSKPAVWIVNPQDNTVSLRDIKIIDYKQDSILVSEGLENGEIVVTAGVQSLYPGQQVKLLDK